MKFISTLFLVLVFPIISYTQIQFNELSQAAGISFVPVGTGPMGGGVAFFDYNNDGFDDIYIVGGLQGDKLYKNNGDGTFTDRSTASGIAQPSSIRYTLGVTTGDINNDGFRDILVTTEVFDRNILFRNNGNGTFTDITNSAGMGTNLGSNFTASFGDFNKDGFLDIYIANYVEEARALVDSASGTMIGFAHKCFPNKFYINNRNNTFTEAAALYNLNDTGCTLAVAFTDFDSDGDVDILSANDFGQWVVPNKLFQNNLPNNYFSDISNASGLNTGMYSMGIAIGDYDQDLDLDYYVTNIGRNSFYRNMGNGSFIDTADAAGVADTWVLVDSLRTSGWGTGFVDIDNDTDLDLFVANGYINAIPMIRNAVENPDRLFLNNGNGTFSNVADSLGLASIHRSRGFAFSDFDNDGKMDLLVVPIIHTNDTSGNTINISLYRNTTNNNNNWLQVKLQGLVTNRDAFGTQMDIHVAGKSWRHEVSGGDSHLSQHSSVAHFGLGTATMVDSLVIHWLNGLKETYYNIPANQRVHYLEWNSFPVGLNKLDQKAELVIFPNPNKGFCNLQFNVDSPAETEISVFNNLGQRVYYQDLGQLETGQQSYPLSLSEFSAGVYQVVVRNNNGQLTKTLVLKK